MEVRSYLNIFHAFCRHCHMKEISSVHKSLYIERVIERESGKPRFFNFSAPSVPKRGHWGMWSVENPDFVIFLGPSAPKRGRLPKVVSRKSWCLNFMAPSAAKSGHLLNVVRGDSRFLNFLATSALTLVTDRNTPMEIPDFLTFRHVLRRKGVTD